MAEYGDLMANLITFRSSDAKRIWRSQIKLRDGNRCFYCGSSEELTIDHVRPLCKGGETNSHNCVTACRACNQAKGSLPVEKFLLTIFKMARAATIHSRGYGTIKIDATADTALAAITTASTVKDVLAIIDACVARNRVTVASSTGGASS